MSPLLPTPETDEAFYAVDPETDYGPALQRIAVAANLDPAAQPVRFEEGSVPVFALGERVAKLYPPSCAPAYRNERTILDHIAGALPVATPRVVAAGPLDAWHFIVMERLPGQPLRARFDDIPPLDRPRLFSEIGDAVRRLHALSTHPLPRPDWSAIMKEQRAGCVARHRRLGLDDTWLARIDAFLDRTLPRASDLPADGHPVLLHTEVMREHIFVDERDGRFEVSGLLDFEPSRVGPAAYELPSVGLFLTEGDPALWSAFLDGLGVPPSQRGDEHARHSMAWALLHRYANLRWWLERLPARSPRRSFDDLAQEWFGSAG
ncbi:MAG: aminoglycoside 3'-phosphotransferase/choline kinase family protein [Deltaproteobacteria bacterium]|nr:aminoglycoside 3'-phosphotransferase/choline kinase family protein [Deltaproteobacteria bacterium]